MACILMMILKIHNSKKWENTYEKSNCRSYCTISWLNDISRVGRGLYSKDIESTSVNTKASSNNAKEDTLKAEIYNTLSKVEKELVSAIGSVNVFDLNSENFEIIKKIRGLKDTIEEIKGQCK